MAFLITKFGQLNQPRLQIAGEEVYFPLKFGNNWQQLRIGVLFSSVGIGAYTDDGNTGEKTIYGASVCRGYKGFFDPYPDDCFTLYPGRDLPSLLVYDVTAIPYVHRFTLGVCLSHRRGSYSVYSASGNNSGWFVLDWYQQHQNLSAFYYDFDRVTTPGSMRGALFAPFSAAQARVHKTYQQFVFDMSTATPDNTGSPGAVQTLAYTGTANVFDTVALCSNITSNMVWNIAAVAVTRWS